MIPVNGGPAEGSAEEQIKSLRAKIVRLQDGGHRALVLIDLIISALRALEKHLGCPIFRTGLLDKYLIYRRIFFDARMTLP